MDTRGAPRRLRGDPGSAGIRDLPAHPRHPGRRMRVVPGREDELLPGLGGRPLDEGLAGDGSAWLVAVTARSKSAVSMTMLRLRPTIILPLSRCLDKNKKINGRKRHIVRSAGPGGGTRRPVPPCLVSRVAGFGEIHLAAVPGYLPWSTGSASGRVVGGWGRFIGSATAAPCRRGRPRPRSCRPG